MLSPSRAALGLVVLLCAGNLWASFLRSGIPLAIDGTVQTLEIRYEKHPGVDDVYLVGVGDRVLHLDKALAQRLSVGDSIRKGSWSTRLEVDEHALEVSPSRDFYGMVLAMFSLIGAARLITRR